MLLDMVVCRRIGVDWAEIERAAAQGAVATLGAAGGIVAVMSTPGFRTALPFGEMLAAVVAAGLWLGGGPPPIGELHDPGRWA